MWFSRLQLPNSRLASSCRAASRRSPNPRALGAKHHQPLLYELYAVVVVVLLDRGGHRGEIAAARDRILSAAAVSVGGEHGWTTFALSQVIWDQRIQRHDHPRLCLEQYASRRCSLHKPHGR